MLINANTVTVNQDWQVHESKAPTFAKVYLIHRGFVQYTDENGTRVLKQDKLYIFPTAIPYSMTTDPQNLLYCTHLHLEVFPVLIEKLVEIDLNTDFVLKPLFETLKNYLENGNSYSKFAYSLAECFEAYCLEKGIFLPPKPYIVDFHAYVSSNYHKRITIKELSERYGYNEQYFIRVFKADLGITPHQYILNYKLNESIKLLRNNLNIQKVAELSGFKDAATFCRAFSKRYGTSPGNFKRHIYSMP